MKNLQLKVIIVIYLELKDQFGLEVKFTLRDLENWGVSLSLVIQGDTLKLLIVSIDIALLLWYCYEFVITHIHKLSCIHRSSVIIPPIEAYVVGGFNSNVRINGDLNKDRLTN